MKSEGRNMPELHFAEKQMEETLGRAYKNALHNLIEVNTVLYQPEIYNRTGFLPASGGSFIRAGEAYEKPWTRDASINCWNAASLLEPEVAGNTLWAVCERQDNGKLIIQRDNQWWDSMLWAAGAWSHYSITGDETFLKNAYEAVSESLALLEKDHYDAEFCLFAGPATMADGISGYPEPPYAEGNGSCFVLDYPDAHAIMALSTNCIYYNAYRCQAAMAARLGRPDAEILQSLHFADKLRKTINARFWLEEESRFGYFIHGSGKKRGELDRSQEGMGLAYAILFDVADEEKTKRILQNASVGKWGMPCVWPHFARYSDGFPGRHNAMVWPVVSGMWASAAVHGGRIDMFQRETENLAYMANQSGDNFYEVYHPVLGEPDGGWQIDGEAERKFNSCPWQTWSATAYLRMVFQGLFGMGFEPDGLGFSPSLPDGWGQVELRGLRYRGMTLDILLEGAGSKIEKVEIDGISKEIPFVSCDFVGSHYIKITMRN